MHPHEVSLETNQIVFFLILTFFTNTKIHSTEIWLSISLQFKHSSEIKQLDLDIDFLPWVHYLIEILRAHIEELLDME